MKKTTTNALKSLSETLILIGIEAAQERRDDEFTSREAAIAAGLSENRMRQILYAKVADGVLLSRKSIVGGRSVILYRAK